MPTHDLEEAGMIGEAERLRGPRDLQSLRSRAATMIWRSPRLEGMKRGGAWSV